MTDLNLPPKEVLIEAAQRGGWNRPDPDSLGWDYVHIQMYRALCDMIWKYEWKSQ